MLRCGRCRASHYCDSECQAKDWPVHKKVCVKKMVTDWSSELTVPRVDVDDQPAGDAHLLRAVMMYYRTGSASAFRRIEALLRQGANPSSVSGEAIEGKGAGMSALHAACFKDSCHGPARLLRVLSTSRAQIDWMRWANVYLDSAARASATPLGACLVPSMSRDAAAAHCVLAAVGAQALASDAGTNACGAGRSASSEAVCIAAGVHVLCDRPCWVEHASVKCPVEDVRLPVHAAAYAWNVDVLRLLLDAGADPHAFSSAGFSTLELALRVNCLDICDGDDYAALTRVVQLLLRAGVRHVRSSRRSDGLGRAIDLAAIRNAPAVFDALLAAGADPSPLSFIGWANNKLDRSCVTCTVNYLMVAVEQGFVDIVQSALRAGVSPETRTPNAEKYTALQVAVVSGTADCVDLLLRHGANPNARYVYRTSARGCNFEATTLYLARAHPASERIVSALRAAGAVEGAADEGLHGQAH